MTPFQRNLLIWLAIGIVAAIFLLIAWKIIVVLAILGAVGYGIYWIWQEQDKDASPKP